MTILDFTFITDHAAVIAVDTLGTSGHTVPKMHVLPHLGAVVAGSGRAVAFRNAASMLDLCQTFDRALEDLEWIFNNADPLRVGLLESGQFEKVDDLFRQALILVGFSESKGCLAAGIVRCQEAFGPVETSTTFGSFISPDDGADSFLPSKLVTDEGAKQLLDAQHAYWPADGTKVHTGGRCLVARLNSNPPTRGNIKPRVEIVMRDLGPLTATCRDAAAPVHEFQAPR